MTLTRRQFLTYTLAASVTAAGTVYGLDRLLEQEVKFDDESTGTPSSHTLETLMTLVGTYVGTYGDTSHYRPYFTWRAENLPGYLSVYSVFTRALDATSKALSGQQFRDANVATRKQILRDALELPLPDSDLFSPAYPQPMPDTLPEIEARLWERFHRQVLGEIVHVFLNTNAWIMLGYDGWPSQPQGLEGYTSPIVVSVGGSG